MKFSSLPAEFFNAESRKAKSQFPKSIRAGYAPL